MPTLLSIKLHRPIPPANGVPRAELARRLQEGLEAGRPLALVSAPAGFGKTTCVSQWLAGLCSPAAWLSLNEDDNTPISFFLYLIAALEQVAGAPGAFPQLHAIQSVLNAGQIPPPEAIANAWAVDMLAFPGKMVLVLDDFHLIQERAILGVFERLFSHLFQPNRPQPLHLVLLARQDLPLPLARLRANNQLTEIRAHDLRFTHMEADELLNGAMGLALREQDLAILDERTEGWVTGLQLAGLSLRHVPDPAGFIRGLGGSQRFILSYLTEEVLNGQSEAVQQFLLDTSILERLNGEVCNAVTGRTDSAQLLEQLYADNLFLVALDDDGRWYRYHHLFRDLLRGRQKALQPERTAGLQRNASQWYAQAARQNRAERVALASQAIQHALAGPDYVAALELIETYAAEILGQWYIKSVQSWLQALPPELVARSPRTNLAFARLYLARADFSQAAPYLARLQAIFTQPGADSAFAPEVQAEWLALQANLLNAQGSPQIALNLAQQALELALDQAPAGGISHLPTLSTVYLAQASACQQLGDIPGAVKAYEQLIRLGQTSGEVMTEMLGLSALALMLIERGRLHDGYDLARQGIERMQQAQVLPPIAAGLYGELGQVAFEWGRLEEAEQYLQQAAQASRLVGFADAEIFYAVTRARIRQMRGDLAGAEGEIQAAVQGMRADAPIVVREQVLAQQVNLFLARQDIEAAERTLAAASLPAGSLPALQPGAAFTFPQGVLYTSAVRIRLHRLRLGMAQGDGPESLQLADHLLEVLSQQQYVPLVLETRLLRAQMQAVLGAPQTAEKDLLAALDLAEPEEYISPFVLEGLPIQEALLRLAERPNLARSRALFIRRILDAGGGLPRLPVKDQAPASSGPAARLAEALTERELEVLRLMAQGLTYGEMAADLVVSINTIRTHVKAIYGKLGVNNRTAALEAGRTLKII